MNQTIIYCATFGLFIIGLVIYGFFSGVLRGLRIVKREMDIAFVNWQSAIDSFNFEDIPEFVRRSDARLSLYDKDTTLFLIGIGVRNVEDEITRLCLNQKGTDQQ